MSLTATVHIRHELVALVPTLRSLEDVRIKVISQGTTNPGTTSFPFHIDYDDRQRLEEALDEDPTVATYELVDWTDDAGIYYIEHTDETKLISTIVSEVNGLLLHTETRDCGWLVRLLLPERDALNTIWEWATEEDIELDVIEIYGNRDAGGEMSFGLTEEQEQALTFALDEGYFDEPRSASLEEIADAMDLSSTAVSGRLRRGMRNLVAATIATDRRED